MVIITETILRIIYQATLMTRESERMAVRVFILKAFMGIMYAVWTIYVLRTFESFTPHCYDPYPSYSLGVFAVIMCFILPQAFITLCVAVIVVIFSPCIIAGLVTQYRDSQAREATRLGVVENTPRVTYDKRRFWGINNCVVCLGDFEEGDEVTPLRCDLRHTFHTQCVIEWF